MSGEGYLGDPRFCQSVIAVLVSRLGGTVTIIQEEFDAVRASNLQETQEIDPIRLVLNVTPSTRIN